MRVVYRVQITLKSKYIVEIIWCGWDKFHGLREHKSPIILGQYLTRTTMVFGCLKMDEFQK